MDWAEDLKFSIKKNTAKKGRRVPAGLQPQSPISTAFDVKLNSTLVVNSAPPRKITGGWAESGNSGKNKIEDERFKKSLDISDDDIPIIPDLDDIQDELLKNEVVEPPCITVNRVTLKELNSDLLTQNVFSVVEDVDLSTLTKCLVLAADLDEADEPWEWDKTFRDIIAEINAEKKISDSVKEPFDEIVYQS